MQVYAHKKGKRTNGSDQKKRKYTEKKNHVYKRKTRQRCALIKKVSNRIYAFKLCAHDELVFFYYIRYMRLHAPSALTFTRSLLPRLIYDIYNNFQRARKLKETKRTLHQRGYFFPSSHHICRLFPVN